MSAYDFSNIKGYMEEIKDIKYIKNKLKQELMNSYYKKVHAQILQ